MYQLKVNELIVLQIKNLFSKNIFDAHKKELTKIYWCAQKRTRVLDRCSRRSSTGGPEVQPPSRVSLMCHVCWEPHPKFKAPSFHRGIDGGAIKPSFFRSFFFVWGECKLWILTTEVAYQGIDMVVIWVSHFWGCDLFLLLSCYKNCIFVIND